MKLPVIDFSSFDLEKPKTLNALGNDIDRALSTTGFMAVTNPDVTAPQLREIFQLSQSFFALSADDKVKSAYRSAEENFGYQGLGVEHLDPTQASDIK